MQVLRAGGGVGRRLAAVALAASLLAGCAAGRAFREGGTAARAGDWDVAVEYYRRAVRAAPDRPEYRIALERARRRAALEHAAAGAALKAQGALSAALAAYRRAYALDPSNGPAGVEIANLQQALRAQMDAARSPAPIEALRAQARLDAAAPLLDAASDEPLTLEFVETGLRAVLDFLGDAAGINVTYDAAFEDRTTSVALTGVTFEEALHRILSANGAFHAVVAPSTIVVAPDTPQQRAAYAPQVIRTFYVSHADVEALAELLATVVRTPELAVQPRFMANAASHTLTVRSTAAVAGIVERVIAAQDKPRAEVVIDIEILEVNRERVRAFGLDLSSYAVGAVLSPSSAPSSGDGASPGADPSWFNLNTLSRGVSPADFYVSAPRALINFLEQDNQTRLVARPQLRGQEGTELTLELGQDVPVPTTAFTPLAAGGAGFNPLTSFQYRPVGVIVTMTPRVTYEEEIVLDLEVENSTLGAPLSVAGQALPTFGSRRVVTRLRLRDGESNLLAGLIREEDRQMLKGFPGLLGLPVLRRLFSATDDTVRQTDIVMLLTPRIVRGHQVTQADVSPIHIGTQRELGVTGPPPRLAPGPAESVQPAGEEVPAPSPPVPPAAGASPRQP